jgi:prepilin-type N-terminal cleavage/methylation domain-containing protein
MYMFSRKGFTLAEIIVVLIIISILAVVAIPNYMTNMQQGAAKAAQNNLITIYGAEKNNYLNTGNYCINTSPNPCDNLPDIKANLTLNITDNYFNYTCITDVSGFSCTATNPSIAGFSLTVTNNPIILPGGTGTANPSCTPAASIFCPT